MGAQAFRTAPTDLRVALWSLAQTIRRVLGRSTDVVAEGTECGAETRARSCTNGGAIFRGPRFGNCETLSDIDTSRQKVPAVISHDPAIGLLDGAYARLSEDNFGMAVTDVDSWATDDLLERIEKLAMGVDTIETPEASDEYKPGQYSATEINDTL